MATWQLNLYHQMPPAIRSLLASIRGYHLYKWRYGRETETLVQDALQREYWSPSQWKVYTENRLQLLLHRAATRVPYYRKQWSERRRNGDLASWDYLENWPILGKEPLRENPHAFVADDCDTRRMFHEHTSGTTGKSLDLWWSQRMVREWYALFEARWRRWNGVSLNDRWAILGGQLVVPQWQDQPPYWIWNHSMRQLYLSSYHLSPKAALYYVQALQYYKVKYLLAYTSSAYILANEIVNQKLEVPTLKVVLTNAEPLYEYQRKLISSGFHTIVKETYGMSEAVIAASECEYGHLHMWPEVGVVEPEVPQDDSRLEEKNLISTGLLNTDMPLIRYRLGDSGILSKRNYCECGRTLPQLDAVSGRNDDLFYSQDGRIVGRLDPVFKNGLPIIEAQIIQEALDRVRILYVPAVGFTQEVEQLIAKRLYDRIGTTNVEFEQVKTIPREQNGKFRAFVSNLSPEERKRVDHFE